MYDQAYRKTPLFVPALKLSFFLVLSLRAGTKKFRKKPFFIWVNNKKNFAKFFNIRILKSQKILFSQIFNQIFLKIDRNYFYTKFYPFY